MMWKKMLLPGLLLLLVHGVRAQNTSGLTGVPDTSFTNNAEFLKQRKKYPDIVLVRDVPSREVKEERNKIYCQTGGRSLHLNVFSPGRSGKKNLPAILLIHGGGWRSGSRTQHIPLAQALAKEGFVCFTAEYRLSTEALYPAAVNDLKAAVRWIRANSTKYRVNPSQIAVLGFSAGGQLAALLATTNQSRLFEKNPCNTAFSSDVNALISLDGSFSFTHPESVEGDETKGPSAASYWFGYKKTENEELRAEASPLTHADQKTPPSLVINSAVDRMHAGRDDFARILVGDKIYYEQHTFGNSPHSFCLFEPWFTPTVQYISVFMKRIFPAVP